MKIFPVFGSIVTVTGGMVVVALGGTMSVVVLGGGIPKISKSVGVGGVVGVVGSVVGNGNMSVKGVVDGADAKTSGGAVEVGTGLMKELTAFILLITFSADC